MTGFSHRMPLRYCQDDNCMEEREEVHFVKLHKDIREL